jgi:hypothetical protein
MKWEERMRYQRQMLAAVIMIASGVATTACSGGHDKNPATAGGDVSASPNATPVATSPAPAVVETTTAPHHSKLKGALVGAAAGHMLGKHAVAGAVAGAVIQHERNKHP